MSSFYASYPVAGGGGVPTYANLSSFPSAVSSGNGALAIARDTDVLYISNGAIWEELADPAFSPTAITALTGDVTATGPGSVPATLATVNSNVGSFGGVASVGTFTVNGKGLITAASNTSIQIAESQVTNLVADLASKVPTTRAVNTTSPLTGGGALSSDLTLAVTSGNLTDVGTDGITVTGGTGAVLGSGTSISQHVADSTHNGYLSSTDWSTFNNKQAALTIGNLTDVGTDGIVITGGTGAVIGSGASIAQHVADSTHNGYLSSTDWSTFNGKQAAGNYITALTGDVTATGPGSAAATIANLAVTNAKIANATIDLTAKVTGALPLLNGGTGTAAASANAAFNALSPLATKGDLVAFSTVNARLPAGTDGFALVADSSQTLGLKYASVVTNPMTTTGDIIYSSNNSGTPTRLGIGTSIQVLKGGTTPSYGQLPFNFLNSTASPGVNQTLTSTSNPIQFYTPSAPINVTLDNSFVAGQMVTIYNKDTSNIITVLANDASTIITIYPLSDASVICNSSTPTTNTSWDGVGVYSTPWVAFTLTANNITINTVSSFWRRVGDSMDIHAYFNVTATGAGVVSYPLPIGVSVNTNKVSSTKKTVKGQIIGGGGLSYTFIGLDPATSASNLYHLSNQSPIVNQSAGSYGAGDTTLNAYNVPISGWTTNKG